MILLHGKFIKFIKVLNVPYCLNMRIKSYENESISHIVDMLCKYFT